MTRRLTVGGLFSGIGGWELGLERAGMEIAWHCEADPFCRRVLEKHWPDVPCFDDVCTLNAGMAEGVDVLCGGFPCQGLSDAGLKLGLLDPRSGLWSEFARLIGEFQPRYVCVENVAALLSRGLGTVLGDLAALGYDAEWDCIPATAFGAAHRRDRIWIVAYPASVNDPRAKRSGTSSRRSETSAGNGCSRSVADPKGAKRHTAQCPGMAEATSRTPKPRECSSGGRPFNNRWQLEPDVDRVVDGVPNQLDRLRSLGNALVPQIAQWIGEQIVSYEASLDGVGMERY